MVEQSLERNQLVAFPYYGGKNSHLKLLLPHLPKCRHYVEPFGGSGSILLNREPSPLETYNDLDQEVVNFFKVLRKEPILLAFALSNTPYSRQEFEEACTSTPGLDDLERARRFFIRTRQSRNKSPATVRDSNWSRSKENSSRGMADTTSKWISGTDDLWNVAKRLRRVQIENLPAIEIIEKYDGPDTLFYCDPPYVPDTRSAKEVYGHEMSDQDHRELARCLNMAKGMVALSGYDSPLYDELYPTTDKGGKWHKIYGPEKGLPTSNGKRMKREVLWTNYDPTTIESSLPATEESMHDSEPVNCMDMPLAGATPSVTPPQREKCSTFPVVITPSVFGSLKKELVTPEEVAGLLRVSRKTVYRRIAEGKLPKPISNGSRLLLFRRTDLETWVDQKGK